MGRREGCSLSRVSPSILTAPSDWWIRGSASRFRSRELVRGRIALRSVIWLSGPRSVGYGSTSWVSVTYFPSALAPGWCRRSGRCPAFVSGVVYPRGHVRTAGSDEDRDGLHAWTPSRKVAAIGSRSRQGVESLHWERSTGVTGDEGAPGRESHRVESRLRPPESVVRPGCRCRRWSRTRSRSWRSATSSSGPAGGAYSRPCRTRLRRTRGTHLLAKGSWIELVAGRNCTFPRTTVWTSCRHFALPPSVATCDRWLCGPPAHHPFKYETVYCYIEFRQ